jgi:hypothetical protein
MKRHCYLFALLCCLFVSPAIASGSRMPEATLAAYADELPWDTVVMVLQRTTAYVSDPYSDLEAMYVANTLTIDVTSTGYIVKIGRSAGVVDVIVLDGL